jgi:hypothetical protein
MPKPTKALTVALVKRMTQAMQEPDFYVRFETSIADKTFANAEEIFDELDAFQGSIIPELDVPGVAECNMSGREWMAFIQEAVNTFAADRVELHEVIFPMCQMVEMCLQRASMVKLPGAREQYMQQMQARQAQVAQQAQQQRPQPSEQQMALMKMATESLSEEDRTFMQSLQARMMRGGPPPPPDEIERARGIQQQLQQFMATMAPFVLGPAGTTESDAPAAAAVPAANKKTD